MKNFHELITQRRTIRKYSETSLDPNDVKAILAAALKSPTSKNARSWQFVVVEDKQQLKELSKLKKSSLKIVSNCALAIVVLGDPLKGDIWIEDTSVASIIIQLQAEDLGLGSCWIQVRGRETELGIDSEEYVKGVLDIPMHLRVLNVIAIGNKAENKESRPEENLLWERIHLGKYRLNND